MDKKSGVKELRNKVAVVVEAIHESLLRKGMRLTDSPLQMSAIGSENGGYDGGEEPAYVEEEEEEEVMEEEEEPRLKYQRMGGSIPELLANDAASCVAVAERMIALGTRDGIVHILDFLGNQNFYMVGRDKSKTMRRVLKVDR